MTGQRGALPFRVLLIGTSAETEARALLARAGVTDAHLVASDSIAQAVGILADHPADAVFVDMALDDGGFGAIVRLQAIAPGVTILPFTTSPSSADATPGLAEAGAPWPAATGGLLDMPYAVACLQRAARKRDADRRLLHVATHDRLTGLANRWLIEDRVRRALARTRRTKAPGALVFADLDRFKEVNDRHGHDVGDQVLASIGLRLQRALRETDTVGRFGGDEFVVVLERVTDRGNAERLAARIGRLIASPIVIDTIELEVGASIGVAVFPEDGEDVPTLMRAADQSMFRTKRQRKTADSGR